MTIETDDQLPKDPGLSNGWLETILTAAIVRHSVPGASLAVATGGRVHRAAAGQANPSADLAATPATVFQIGSITKTYTATQIMLLIDQGAIQLGTPVAEVIPGFRVGDPEVSRQLTIAHLLTHTGGIGGDALVDAGRGEDALERTVRAYSFLGQDVPLGTVYSYCNSGYAILGRVIECLTGRTWDDALHEFLLEPLGVEKTLTLPEEVVQHRAAVGHVGDDQARPAEWSIPRSIGPAGAVCATAEDVVAFAQLHLDGGLTRSGARLLREESVRAMRERRVDKTRLSGDADHWGLGWMIFDLGGAEAFGHFGGTAGQYSYLVALPEYDTVIVLLTNGGLAADFYREITTAILGAAHGLEPFLPATPAEQAPVDPSLAGTYENHGSRRLTVEARDGELHAHLEQPSAWTEVGRSSTSSFPLLPLQPDEGRYVVTTPQLFDQGSAPCPVAFLDILGNQYIHIGSEGMRRIAPAP